MAANQTKVYGEANPTLTGTLTGVLNGDAITGAYTTTATTA
ncbi:MBG domain-containing protein, partial [Hymenobacter frigidus]